MLQTDKFVIRLLYIVGFILTFPAAASVGYIVPSLVFSAIQSDFATGVSVPSEIRGLVTAICIMGTVVLAMWGAFGFMEHIEAWMTRKRMPQTIVEKKKRRNAPD